MKTKSVSIMGKVFIEKDPRSHRESPSVDRIYSIFPKELQASSRREADAIVRLKWRWISVEHKYGTTYRYTIVYGHETRCVVSISTPRGNARKEFSGAWIPDQRGQTAHPGSWPVYDVCRYLKEFAPTKTCPYCDKEIFLACHVCPECGHPFTEAEMPAAKQIWQEQVKRNQEQDKKVEQQAMMQRRKSCSLLLGWTLSALGSLVFLAGGLFILLLIIVPPEDKATFFQILAFMLVPTLIIGSPVLAGGIYLIHHARKAKEVTAEVSGSPTSG